jgi:hypothetical protein
MVPKLSASTCEGASHERARLLLKADAVSALQRNRKPLIVIYSRAF